jgi:hypothetical protein
VFNIQLRLRALTRRGVVEFSKFVEWPFIPVDGITLLEGSDPDEGIRYPIVDVLWLSEAGRFVAILADDEAAAADFGDDLAALKSYYEMRGWEEVRSGPLRVIGWPEQIASTA